MDNFEQIRSHLVAGDFHVSLQEPFVLGVELSLDGGSRRQTIFLSELQDDDARPLLRVSTLVAPLAGIDCERALQFNWESRVGYLALGDLDGDPWLQLCENRPYAGLDGAEIDRLVLEIGGMGDQLERLLDDAVDAS